MITAYIIMSFFIYNLHMRCFSNFPITRILVKQNYDNAILVEMRPNTSPMSFSYLSNETDVILGMQTLPERTLPTK